MTRYNGTEELDIESILNIYHKGEIGQLIHAEVRETLIEREHEFVGDELQDLVLENHTQYGGSPHGFFYNGEMFCVGSPKGKDNIQAIASELYEKAGYLQQSRIDIPQFTTHLAHFLSCLNAETTTPVEFIANCPSELGQLSRSLNILKGQVKRDATPETMESVQFDPEDKDRSVFFMHLERISEPLGRFLFRRIAK